jgi:hypothetical protein
LNIGVESIFATGCHAIHLRDKGEQMFWSLFDTAASLAATRQEQLR